MFKFIIEIYNFEMMKKTIKPKTHLFKVIIFFHFSNTNEIYLDVC